MGSREVLIVVPTRNEVSNIEAAIRSLLPKSLWPFAWKMSVADGCSDDGTVAKVGGVMREDARIDVFNNPARIQSAGVNLAVALERSADIVVRADAHAKYPPDYVAGLVSTLDRTGADSVVVGMISESRSGNVFGVATAAAQNSRLGNGGAAHRRGGISGFVEHGHHAAFKRSAFDEMGGYDVSFTHNEDAEFDMRMRSVGKKIWLEGALTPIYFVRETPWALATQYWNHGRGRAHTVMKHRRIRLRQLLPAAATAANIVAAVTALFWLDAIVVPAIYASACVAVGCAGGRQGAEKMAGVPAMIMHHAWGVGFLWGVSTRG